MPRRCSVCAHADRDEINHELSAGVEMKLLASLYNVSEMALSRHKRNHLMPAQRDRLASDPELGDVDVLSEMRALYRRLKVFLERAEEADDWPAVKAFHSEARKDLELLAKLVGELADGGATVNVQIDQRTQQVILGALGGHPEARLAVAEALKALE